MTVANAIRPSGLTRVHVDAAEPRIRDRMVDALRRAGFGVATEPDRSPDTVIVAVAGTVDQAVEAYDPPCWPLGNRLLIVADTFSRMGVLRAMRVGVRVMLRSTEADPERLVAALHSVRNGDCRMPREALFRLFAHADDPAAASRGRVVSQPLLTPRQIMVLALVADGHGNAAIASALSCSEHTVKNIIYDMMARLQVRNRTHAVAHAVRSGLI